MKSQLKDVRNFYNQVKANADFDYGALAQQFGDHDILSDPPPQFQKIRLPFFGNLDLTLVAVDMSQSEWFGSLSSVAKPNDDGKYGKSQVVFMARETPVLEKAGYKAIEFGPFAGLVVLSCHQSCHKNLFGHPAEYYANDQWQKRSPQEFVTDLLPRLIKNAIPRFFPAGLHEYPFGADHLVKVFARDTTKVGGHYRYGPGGQKEAMAVFQSLSKIILEREQGNVHVEGYIESGGIMFVLPAFGRPHVAFRQ